MMLSVARAVDADPQEAWDVIASTATWASWGPAVSAVDPPDAVVQKGMRGRVRSPLGLWLPFEVTECDPPRSWSWRVAGIPATRHEVFPTDAGCRISISVPVVFPAYLVVCRLALERIAGLLE